jgi:GNAT superfamily N-acetyltransferase
MIGIVEMALVLATGAAFTFVATLLHPTRSKVRQGLTLASATIRRISRSRPRVWGIVVPVGVRDCDGGTIGEMIRPSFAHEWNQMSEWAYGIRVATPEDEAAVTAVLTASYSSLLKHHYDAGLLARALPAMTKANPVLLRSGTYYVAEADGGGVAGCGGWTFERPGTTEVAAGYAHVRHFGTDPNWVGRGVAREILLRCIREAADKGAHVLETYSTLAAVGFYRALGFAATGPIDVPMGPALVFPSVHMTRKLT